MQGCQPESSQENDCAERELAAETLILTVSGP